MDTFAWNDCYLTGEHTVDTEHKELVRIINLVGNMVGKELTQPDNVESVLDQLTSYAVNHFAHEEALMVSAHCDVRHREIHCAIHQDFARQISTMRATKLKQNDTEYLLRFLTNWLSFHILGIDQSMTRQIGHIRHGMSPAEAFEKESVTEENPITTSLLNALNALYRVIASRNEALVDLNQTLEEQVEQRTKELKISNETLQLEHTELKTALAAVEATKQRLIESERKRSIESQRYMELLLAQIVDGDPVPTLVINAEHKVTHWNRACTAVTRVPANAMIGTNRQWSAFYPAERPIMADLIVSGHLEGLEAHYHGKFHRSAIIDEAYEAEDFFPQFGDNGCWLFFTAAPLRNGKGEIIGAIETLQDVTERHRAEENLRDYQNHLEELVEQRTTQLAQANTQLLQSEKLASIGQLAAGVAHEINNPIGYVHSNIGSLETYLADVFRVLSAYEAAESFIAPEQAIALKTLRQTVDLAFLKEDIPVLMHESKEGISRVKKIVQDLKDFSRVDSAKEWQWANLHQGIDSTINIVANEIRYKADLIKEYGEIPEVECLPTQLNQVFMNLLVNAAHAIGDQRGSITIRTGTEGDHVWLTFSDTGSGIPETVLAKIFDPFFTTKPIGKGTGLGLSLSYGIIQNHQGTIEVTSKMGQGSTFRITLPIKQAAPPQPTANELLP